MSGKVIIVGGGFTGVAAALSVARNGGKALILEKNPVILKKLAKLEDEYWSLYPQGEIEEILEGYARGGQLIASAVANHPPEEMKGFWEGLGVPVVETTDEESDGPVRMLPEGRTREELVDALLGALEKLDVEIMVSSKAQQVILEKKAVTGVMVHGRVLEADAVVIATGGRAKPKLGSSGEGYEMVKMAGHTITELYPGMVSLETVEKLGKQLNGAVLKDVAVTVHKDRFKWFERRGRLEFDQLGITGPLAWAISSRVARALARGSLVEVGIDLLPHLTKHEVTPFLTNMAEKNAAWTVGDMLHTFMPGRMIPVVGKFAGARIFSTYNAQSHLEKKGLALMLKDLRISIKATGTFNKAFVTSGGVASEEVDPATMGSTKVKGLYFAGEILDIDGETGAHNLLAAYATACTAAAAACAGKKKRTTKKKSSGKAKKKTATPSASRGAAKSAKRE